MVDKHDLKGTHWEFGNSKVRYESVTTESHMSEARDKICRDHCRAKTEPESLQLGKLLRQSHIQLSHRPDREVAKSEAKTRWTPQKIEVVEGFAATNGAELKKSHIDLAVGDSKSAKEWVSDLKGKMSAAEEEKFACKVPQGFQHLGAELRKSSVLLHAGRHDFRSGGLPVHRSEANRAWSTKEISSVTSYSETLGKELRTSNIDLGPGNEKTYKGISGQTHSIMADQNDKKWACKQPEGFYHLIAELKKSNITLGSDATAYGSEGVKRPVRDDRNAAPAGHVPGF